MTRLDYFKITHPSHDLTADGYPKSPSGACLCAKSIQLTEHCLAGEGFFDCRDCWNSQITPREGDEVFGLITTMVDISGYRMEWEEQSYIEILRYRPCMKAQIGKTVFLTYNDAETVLNGK